MERPWHLACEAVEWANVAAAYALLTPTHEELRRQSARDTSRPSIEYYRRDDRIEVLMPVLDS